MSILCDDILRRAPGNRSDSDHSAVKRIRISGYDRLQLRDKRARGDDHVVCCMRICRMPAFPLEIDDEFARIGKQQSAFGGDCAYRKLRCYMESGNQIRCPFFQHIAFKHRFRSARSGPGGAEPMLESDVLKKWTPDLITALHIAPELPVGTISTKSGLLFANTSELVIDLEGKGGHAAYPHTADDMVVAASTLVTQLQTVISRNTDPLDSAVITVGTITGGTAQNIIAEDAHLEGTIRTLSEESMRMVKKRIEELVKGIETSSSGFSFA